jgi:hypothetical protein
MSLALKRWRNCGGRSEGWKVRGEGWKVRSEGWKVRSEECRVRKIVKEV